MAAVRHFLAFLFLMPTVIFAVVFTPLLLLMIFMLDTYLQILGPPSTRMLRPVFNLRRSLCRLKGQCLDCQIRETASKLPHDFFS